MLSHKMGKHDYFTLPEFVNSSTAKKKGIDNTPSFEVVEHLNELVDNFLDPLRAAYGMPIRITSGYRCPELNKAVGGSSTSVHMLGWACDMQVGGSFEKFKTFVVDWVKKNNIKFDQLLLEKNANGDKWIHIGLKNNAGQQRCQIKVMEV